MLVNTKYDNPSQSSYSRFGKTMGRCASGVRFDNKEKAHVRCYSGPGTDGILILYILVALEVVFILY